MPLMQNAKIITKFSVAVLGYGFIYFNLFFFMKDKGGLDAGYIHVQYQSLIMLVPLIIFLAFQERTLQNILPSVVLLATLVSTYQQKIMGNYIVVVGGIVIMLGVYYATRALQHSGYNNITLHMGSLLALTSYYGIKNWQAELAIGEDRLWRSVPWHNPSGIIATMIGFILIAYGYKALVEKKSIRGVICILGAALAFCQLILSGSRGAILVTLIVSLLPLAVFKKFFNVREFFKALLLFSVFLVSIYILFQSIKGGYASDGTSYTGTGDPNVKRDIFNRSQNMTGNFQERLKYWVTGLKIFADYPIFGSGLGSWNSLQWLYRAPNETLSTAAHNDYIQYLTEGGLLVSVPLFFFLGLFVLKVRGWKSFSVLQMMTYVSGLAFLLHSGIDFNTRYPITWAIFMIMYASLPSKSQVKIIRGSKEFKVTVVSILIILSFSLIIKSTYQRAEILDRYNGKIERNENIPGLDIYTSFNNEIVLHNANKLVSKGLDNMAINELKFGEVYSPGDIRLRIYREELEYGIGDRNEPTFENIMESMKPYFWNTGELNAIYAYNKKGDREKALQKINKLEQLLPKYPGWEYHSTMGWVYINKLIYIRNFGGGCETPEAKIVIKNFNDLMSISEGIIKEAEIPTFKMICTM